MVEYRQEVLKEKVDRMTINYNKLVRDRIPEIIHQRNKSGMERHFILQVSLQPKL